MLQRDKNRCADEYSLMLTSYMLHDDNIGVHCTEKVFEERTIHAKTSKAFLRVQRSKIAYDDCEMGST